MRTRCSPRRTSARTLRGRRRGGCSTRSSSGWRSRGGHERRLDGAHKRAEAPALPAPGADMSVTLLFTDIEGSTRIVQQLGDRYAAVLEEHRRAVRAALAAGGGAAIDCRGAEVYVRVPDAA